MLQGSRKAPASWLGAQCRAAQNTLPATTLTTSARRSPADGTKSAL
ncbi:hypothetical protein [Burkholderia sp. Ax-1719]|nr:hypothetical protein [Burkholderia sp. Ax-1719]